MFLTHSGLSYPDRELHIAFSSAQTEHDSYSAFASHANVAASSPKPGGFDLHLNGICAATQRAEKRRRTSCLVPSGVCTKT